jgi:hypothetical protein
MDAITLAQDSKGAGFTDIMMTRLPPGCSSMNFVFY